MDDQNNADQPSTAPEAPQPPASEPTPVQPPAAPEAAATQPQPPAQPTPVEPQPQSQQPPQPGAPVPQPQQPPQPGAPVPQPQQPSYPYGQPVPQPYYQQPAPQSSGKAMGALVCGILAILFAALPLFGIVLGIVAIVLAGKAVKESGKDGKATGGKVCGIIGIVLSVLAFILYLVLSFGAMAYIASNAADDYQYSGSSSALNSQSPSSSSSSAEDELIGAAAAAELDKIKAKDSAIVKDLSEKADADLADATDYSLTELGVDPTLFVEWMMADFDYEIDSVIDYGDGTGVAYADVTLRDSLAFATTFLNDAQAAVDSGEMQALDETAAKARLGEIYRAAMDKTTDMTTDYVSFDMTRNGDSWQVDSDSLESELEYLFGL